LDALFIFLTTYLPSICALCAKDTFPVIGEFACDLLLKMNLLISWALSVGQCTMATVILSA